MKKNEYLDEVYERIQAGEDVGKADRALAWAYKQNQYQRFGQICLDQSIHGTDEAAELARVALTAGIEEIFVTGNWSNQLDSWAALDAAGMKLRGIEYIENADYIADLGKWGESDRLEKLAALRFSFDNGRRVAMIEFTKDWGMIKEEMVALFDERDLSEDEALRLIRADQDWTDKLVIVSQGQYETVFRSLRNK